MDKKGLLRRIASVTTAAASLIASSGTGQVPADPGIPRLSDGTAHVAGAQKITLNPVGASGDLIAQKHRSHASHESHASHASHGSHASHASHASLVMA